VITIDNFSIVSEARNGQVTFTGKPQMKINNCFLIYSRSDQAVKTTVFNWTCFSFTKNYDYLLFRLENYLRTINSFLYQNLMFLMEKINL